VGGRLNDSTTQPTHELRGTCINSIAGHGEPLALSLRLAQEAHLTSKLRIKLRLSSRSDRESPGIGPNLTLRRVQILVILTLESVSSD
jgi:hypothetical protein